MQRAAGFLRNARFSVKVGGGFIAMILITAVVGAVGTYSILQFRNQSDLNARATSAMASLQQASAAQEEYLFSRMPEQADAAKAKIQALNTDLRHVKAALSDNDIANEGVAQSIDLVTRLEGQFDGVIGAVGTQQQQIESLIKSAGRLEALATQISDKMTSVQREASGAAKKANSVRNRADKISRIVTTVYDQSLVLEKMFSVSDGAGTAVSTGAPLQTAVFEEAAGIIADVRKKTKKASKLKVDGVDPAALKALAAHAAGLKELIDSTVADANTADLPAAREAISVAVNEMWQQSDELRGSLYAAIDSVRKIASSSQSKLTIVDLVSVNSTKFLREALDMRSSTMELFAGLGSISPDDVVTRLAILQNLANVLMGDAAAFPEIKDTVTDIQAEVVSYEAEFVSMAAATEAFEAQRQVLVGISADVRSQIATLAEQQSQSSIQMATTSLALIALAVLLAIAAGGLLAVLLSRVITKPTRALTNVMAKLADGDTDIDIPTIDQRDEIGDMSRTVQVFKDNARERLRLEEVNQANQARRAERQTSTEALIINFREQVQGMIGALEYTAHGMNGTATELSDIAQQSASQASDTAQVSEDASMSVENVASAAEELSASISEIGEQVSRTTAIVSNATGAVRETNGKVNSLAEAANKIGEVIVLIRAIAEQTNLLALNATIEAARAGEAGKGFAVVAAEVKELANQTSSATEEISAQISTIQNSTSEAVDAIGSISTTMEEVDGYTQAIASAVSQQGAATNEISGNVLRASDGTKAVLSNMSSLSHAVEQTRGASANILTASGDVSARTDALKQEIDGFLEKVSAA